MAQVGNLLLSYDEDYISPGSSAGSRRLGPVADPDGYFDDFTAKLAALRVLIRGGGEEPPAATVITYDVESDSDAEHDSESDSDSSWLSDSDDRSDAWFGDEELAEHGADGRMPPTVSGGAGRESPLSGLAPFVVDLSRDLDPFTEMAPTAWEAREMDESNLESDTFGPYAAKVGGCESCGDFIGGAYDAGAYDVGDFVGSDFVGSDGDADDAGEADTNAIADAVVGISDGTDAGHWADDRAADNVADGYFEDSTTPADDGSALGPEASVLDLVVSH